MLVGDLLNFTQVIINGVLIGGIFVIVSVGLSLIFGVMRIFNVAHGAFVMIGAYITYWLHGIFGLDPYLSALITAPTLFGLGAAVYVLSIHRILKRSVLETIIITYGLYLLFENVALYTWTSDYRALITSYPPAISVGDLFISFTRFANFLIIFFIFLALYMFLKRTLIGKAIRATCQDQRAAQLMGINVGSVNLVVFSLGTALAGVAGTLFALVFTIQPTMGSGLVFTGISAVVLGGIGSVIGAVLGGLIIGITESVVGYYISPQLMTGIPFLLLIIILVLKPTGLYKGIPWEQIEDVGR
jgi:branched-chain amino acid transport system permease protein